MCYVEPGAGDADWAQRVAYAKEVLSSLISRLPEQLRLEAVRIGYELRRRNMEIGEEFTMGGYVRPCIIRLYLDAIAEAAAGSGTGFHREIEITYLHEFGHHLGLEEQYIEKLGL